MHPIGNSQNTFVPNSAPQRMPNTFPMQNHQGKLCLLTHKNTNILFSSLHLAYYPEYSPNLAGFNPPQYEQPDTQISSSSANQTNMPTIQFQKELDQLIADTFRQNMPEEKPLSLPPK